MNLEQAIAITNAKPNLSIFIPIQYDLGLMVRPAKDQGCVEKSILNKAPFLNPDGYEVCVHQLSNAKAPGSKGKLRKDIPNATETWAAWGIEKEDLARQNYMVI